MILLHLLACSSSPAPTEGPGAVPPEQAGPVQGRAVVDASDKAVVGKVGGEPLAPELVNPAAPIDQKWIMKPSTKVSQPDWPVALLSPEQCGDAFDEAPPEEGCVTQELKCGDNLIGQTLGGGQRFDTAFYAKKHCWPATVKHDEGEERVYRLTVPEGEWRAWVTLYSPCADLNVAAMRWDDSTCPTIDDKVKTCEMSVKTGRVADRIELTTQTDGWEPGWLVVVEGPKGNEGPFSLHVQCAPGLGGPIDESRLIGAP